MNIIRELNVAIRFILEVIIVIAGGYLGVKLPKNKALKLIFGTLLPLVIILIWARFGAPKSPNLLSRDKKLLLELAFFLFGTVALYLTIHKKAASAFAVAAVLNTFLLFVL